MVIKKLQKSIHLKNAGRLELFFIGTGSAFSKQYFQTNMLIVKGNTNILVDCGTMCPYAFAKYGSNISLIDNFLITHSHADHMGGMEEVALLGRYVAKKKPILIITEEYKKKLWNNSLKGGLSYGEDTEKQRLSFDDYFQEIIPTRISGQSRPVYEAQVDSINIKMFRTKHIRNKKNDWKTSFISYGILIDNRILFSGDTQFDPPLFEFVLKKYPSIEWIFHDCQFYEGGVHASYNELKTLPAELRKKIFLCHYGDDAQTKYNKNDGFADLTEQGVYYCFD